MRRKRSLAETFRKSAFHLGSAEEFDREKRAALIAVLPGDPYYLPADLLGKRGPGDRAAAKVVEKSKATSGLRDLDHIINAAAVKDDPEDEPERAVAAEGAEEGGGDEKARQRNDEEEEREEDQEEEARGGRERHGLCCSGGRLCAALSGCVPHAASGQASQLHRSARAPLTVHSASTDTCRSTMRMTSICKGSTTTMTRGMMTAMTTATTRATIEREKLAQGVRLCACKHIPAFF